MSNIHTDAFKKCNMIHTKSSSLLLIVLAEVGLDASIKWDKKKNTMINEENIFHSK